MKLGKWIDYEVEEWIKEYEKMAPKASFKRVQEIIREKYEELGKDTPHEETIKRRIKKLKGLKL